MCGRRGWRNEQQRRQHRGEAPHAAECILRASTGPPISSDEHDMTRNATIVGTFLGVLAVFTLAPAAFQAAPTYDVDPLWPKPLPNHWLLGSVTGVAVDAQDHIWVVHRGYDSFTARTEIGAATTPKTADECCVPAPPVLEFDAAGNLVGHWGGPGEKYEWPVSPGGIAVDAQSVWITAPVARRPRLRGRRTPMS
jgi:hypothetical protein